MATKGTATITAGNTYVVVQHTLGSTSIDYIVQVKVMSEMGGRSFWGSNKGVASFRINISAKDPTTDFEFRWWIV